MPFSNPTSPVNFINKSVQATGTPDVDAAFLNTFQNWVDVIGDGLATYSSNLEALQSTVSGLGTPYTDPGHITGLIVEWSSATQLIITAGSCYIPATGTIVSKSTSTTVNLTGLAANTWYYMYAANVGGALSFDSPSTTIPTAYHGHAKHKNGDSSRRYVGEFRTAPASTNALGFIVDGDWVQWVPTFNGFTLFQSPYPIINVQRITTNTTVQATIVPSGTRLMRCRMYNYANDVAYYGSTSSNISTSYDNWFEPGEKSENVLPLTGDRQFIWRHSGGATTGNLTLVCTGYLRDR